MLTTNTAFKVLTGFASFLYSYFNELSDAFLVENLEWVYVQNLLFEITWQETCNVVAAVTESPKDRIEELLAKANIDGQRRGETFTLQEFADVANAWASLIK